MRELRWADAQRRRDVHDPPAARECGERPDHPPRRRRCDEARIARLPLPGSAEPGSAPATRGSVAMATMVDNLTARQSINLELDDIQSGALHARPSPTSATTSSCASITVARGQGR